MDMCRACLTKDSELSQIDDVCFKNYNLLTNLTASREDNLPQSLCQKCWHKIDLFINFRTQCIASESSFHTIVDSNCQEIKCEEKSFIKIQYKREYEDDADMKEHAFQVIDNVKIKTEIENDDSFFADPYIDVAVAQIKSENTEELTPEVTVRKKRKYTKRKAILCPEIKTEKKKRGRKPKNAGIGYTAKEKTAALDCGLCPKSYIDRASLYKHLEKHKQGSLCAICKESFSSWPRLLAHRLNHVQPGQRRCHLCWKAIIKDHTAEYHYYTTHFEGEFPGLQCKICSNLFSNARKLTKHISSKHSDNKYICDHCSKVFRNKEHLKIHMRNHSDDQIYMCDLCGFTCKFHCNIVTHRLRKHSTERFYCTQCSRLFKNQEKLDTHKCRQTTICAECGKSFKSRGRYLKHSVVHSGARKYNCDRCPATFKYKQNLITHTDRHDGNRRKKCEFCDAKFYTRNVLIKHIRIHTGERPFVCQVCNKGFTASHNLKVHMKVHGQIGQDLLLKKTE